jgi:hypothetical protein
VRCGAGYRLQLTRSSVQQVLFSFHSLHADSTILSPQSAHEAHNVHTLRNKALPQEYKEETMPLWKILGADFGARVYNVKQCERDFFLELLVLQLYYLDPRATIGKSCQSEFQYSMCATSLLLLSICIVGGAKPKAMQ